MVLDKLFQVRCPENWFLTVHKMTLKNHCAIATLTVLCTCGNMRNEPSIFVGGDLAESIKGGASDRLGDLVPQVRARPDFSRVFHDMALLGLCLVTFLPTCTYVSL